MRHCIIIAGLIVSISNSFAQTNENVVFVSDIRKQGIAQYDTSILGRKSNDVFIERTFVSNARHKHLRNDSAESYRIHFYKEFDNKLRNYFINFDSEDAFDKASYKWLNDTIVSITLINSVTDQRKNFRMFQRLCENCTAGLMSE